jgi:hypothetical protein
VKSVLLALLATLVGVAMVGGGIYGLVKGDDDDDKASAGTTTSVPSFTPATPNISPTADECAQVKERDPRLAELDDREFQATGDETGTMTADLICNGDTVVLTVELKGLREKDTTTYFAWLYKSRKRAEQVGTIIGSAGNGFGSITLGLEADSTKYNSIVITRVPFGQTEERPRKVVFRTPL